MWEYFPLFRGLSFHVADSAFQSTKVFNLFFVFLAQLLVPSTLQE